MAALVSLLEKTKNDQQQWEAARGLASQLSRLDAVQVNRVGDVLLERISISTDFLVLKEAGQCLVALAPQLELAKLTRAGDRFVTLLDKSHDGQVIEAATKCLVELAPWMQDSQVTLGWDSIVARTEKSTDKVILAIANNPLIVLAPHLNSKDIASRLDKYLSQLHKSTDLGLQRAALAGLIALTPRLDVVETTRSGDALLALLEQSSIAEILAATVEGLVVVAPRLDVTQMTRAGAALVTLLQKSQELSVVMAVANCLQVLTPSQIDPVQVTGAWDALLAMLEKSTQVGGPSIAGRALVALAPWVDGAQVTHALRIMVALLQNSTEVLKVDAAADCLRVLAPSRLDAVHVAGAWNARLALLENSADRAALRVSGRALVALAPWVEEAQVMRCARVLLKLMESSNNSEDRFAAWYTCLALAGRMEVAQRGSVAEALLPSLYKDSDSGGGHSSAFEAILPLLDPLTHDRIVTAALPIVLCFVASNERANDRIVRPDGFDGSESDLAQVAAIWSFAVVMKAHPRSVAKLMSHPGCVGELRELLLQRFEELLFHDGQPVYLKPEPAANAATTPVTNPPPRRFHNLHDAAAWIQHNWPDFDLETNHPLIWRSVK
ncbi:MAG: hypothetical protein NT069_27975 [Planctomycetota bacterium]|nr:hypothetical protein [Planctomycetota bacterium]